MFHTENKKTLLFVIRIPLFDSRFVSNASVVFLNSSVHVWLDSLCSQCIESADSGLLLLSQYNSHTLR